MKTKLADKPYVLDVRNRGEWDDTGVIDGAALISVNDVRPNIDKIPKDKPVFVHCKGGARSLITYTLLKKYGVDAYDIKGGLMAMQAQNIPLTKAKF
mmetsp:Transcript_60034/g.83402  ORF Transcript_60034/g.83402 Transcript_60034/m.83402 type:complete len:97 (-) Transcript_60034:20-310(-)